jgi:hypothetical protein
MEFKFDEAEPRNEYDPTSKRTDPNSLIDKLTFVPETVPLRGATPEQLFTDVGCTAKLPVSDPLSCNKKPLSDCGVVLLFG